MHTLFFLIGSSGSGKSTAAQSIEVMNLSDLIVLRSDSKRVPPVEEMIKQYGRQDEWQRQNTIEWTKEIKEKYLEHSDVLFDIQSRPSFVDEACEENHVDSYEVILFDCSDEERKRRLVEDRRQPELASDRMMDWARYLREKCVGENHTIIDNTHLTKEGSLQKLLAILGR